MKSYAVLAIAGCAAAQMAGVPSCAESCLAPVMGNIEEACANQVQTQEQILPCLTENGCTPEDISAIVSLAAQVCSAASTETSAETTVTETETVIATTETETETGTETGTETETGTGTETETATPTVSTSTSVSTQTDEDGEVTGTTTSLTTTTSDPDDEDDGSAAANTKVGVVFAGLMALLAAL